jgi:hypothetical protein
MTKAFQFPVKVSLYTPKDRKLVVQLFTDKTPTYITEQAKPASSRPKAGLLVVIE